MGQIDSSRFKRLIKSWGCDLVGFGDVREGLSRELITHPIAISLALRNRGNGSSPDSGSDLYMHINPDTEGKMESLQKKIVGYLRKHGYLAFPIPPNTIQEPRRFSSVLFEAFPHRMAATCAGLGWIGKNGMLINRQFGLQLLWATVLTNAPITPSAKPIMESLCRECELCVAACPPHAIHGVKWNRYADPSVEIIDIDVCMGQLKANEKAFGTFACGVCTTICPYNIMDFLSRSKSAGKKDSFPGVLKYPDPIPVSN